MYDKSTLKGGMINLIYAYIRVSTKQQKIERDRKSVV